MMFTNASCTIFDSSGSRLFLQNVYWEQSEGMNPNNNSRDPADSVLIIVPASETFDISLESIVFKGAFSDDITLDELRKKHKFYIIKEISEFLFGANPHYEITGA